MTKRNTQTSKILLIASKKKRVKENAGFFALCVKNKGDALSVIALALTRKLCR